MDTTGTFDMAKVRNLKPLNPDPYGRGARPETGNPNPSNPQNHTSNLTPPEPIWGLGFGGLGFGVNMDTTGTFDMAKVRNLKPLNPDP